jgi:hypothetical protein
LIADILGRTNNCYTGGDCWDYDYSDRSILILSIIIGIVVIYKIAKRIRNKGGDQ